MSEKNHVSDVIEAENQALDTFEGVWNNATENQNIFSLDHWTSEEKTKIKRQGRIPYVFDQISHPLSILLGTQRDTRFDITFFERNREDGVKAEILNAVWKYFADIYDFIHVESEVFQDGVISSYGVFGGEMYQGKNYSYDLKVCRVPFDELVWDTNFRQYDLSDAYWMRRARWYRRSQLEKQYADKKELIELAGIDAGIESTVRPKKLESWFDKQRDLIGTREFYERNWIRKYFIWQQGAEAPEETPYATKQDAEAEIKDRVQKVIAAVGAGILNPLLEPLPQWAVDYMDVPVIMKSVVMINGVLEEPKEFKLGRFPYKVFFPYFNDGTFWGAIDRLKDPQMFVNRTMATIDNQMGTSAKGLLIGDSRIPDQDWDRLKEMWGKTGGAVRTKWANSIKVVEGQGVNPQFLSILDRVKVDIENNMGGANNLGQKQSAQESGRAVLARQAQAGLDNFIPLDNLRRTKQDLGEDIAWYITNEVNEPRKMRIVGDKLSIASLQENAGMQQGNRPNVGYLEINTTSDNTITGLEVDVVVDEAQHSVTKDQSVLASLIDAAKSGLIPVPPPPSVIMGLLSGLAETAKQEWEAHVQQVQSKPQDDTKVSVNFKDMPLTAQRQQLERMGFTVEQRDLMINALTKPEVLNNITKMMTEKQRNQTMLTKQEMSMQNSGAEK